MTEQTDLLAQLRQEIDTVDQHLVALLNKRAQLALQARIAKGKTDIYRPEREAKVLSNVASHSNGPLSEEAIVLLFRSIIDVCRKIQEIET